MQLTITIDRDEDGVSITECPALPGCVGQGRTKDEAILTSGKPFDSALRSGPTASYPRPLKPGNWKSLD